MRTLTVPALLIAVVALVRLRSRKGLRPGLVSSADHWRFETMTRRSPYAADSRTSRTRARTLIACVAMLLAAATLPLAWNANTGVASAADRCRSSGLSNSDLGAMTGAWRSARRLSLHLRLAVNRPGKWPLGGQCGSTRWAFAYFLPVPGQRLSQHDQIQEQDGADVFRRLAGGPWRDIGDTGGATPCDNASYGRGFPKSLVKIWGLRCTA